MAVVRERKCSVSFARIDPMMWVLYDKRTCMDEPMGNWINGYRKKNPHVFEKKYFIQLKSNNSQQFYF